MVAGERRLSDGTTDESSASDDENAHDATLASAPIADARE
jgi:hypothetical protein